MLDLNISGDFPHFPITSYNQKVMIPDRGLPESPKAHKPSPGRSLCLKPYRMMKNVRKISASHNNNLCIDRDDALWVWGAQYLKDDTTPHRERFEYESCSAPHTVEYVPVKRMENVMTADAGAWHALAVTKDGRLWAWGKNHVGQLGRGDCIDSQEPIFIMDHVRSVFANAQRSFAIKEDGSLWGWGYNGNGVLLDAPEFCTSPHLLMENVTQISASPDVVLIVKTDHTLWGWGSKSAGSFLFQEPPARSYSPTLIARGAANVSISKLDGKDLFGYLISDSGELFVLGNRGGGGNPVWQFKVQQINSLYQLMEGAADGKIGADFSLIRMQDGRAFSTGVNDLGECGDGKSSGYRTKLVPLAMDAVDIAVGYSHGMLLQESGDLWIWGGEYGWARE